MAASGRPALVVFDVDQVLFRFTKRVRLANLVRLTGLPAARIQAAIWDSGFDDECDAGVHDAEGCLRGTCERLGVQLSAEALMGARFAGMRPNNAVWRLVEQVGRVAQIATLSNNNALLKRELPRRFPQVAQHFGENLYFSSDFRIGKPHREVFQRLLEWLGQTPQRTLFVDDMAQYIAGARAAGLLTHHFTSARALAADLHARGLLQATP